MRILGIGGRNLASLAGEFALDFEHGPLADAGLFAIAGPTGAGKSTLLDALCLALYDRTPRLESKSSYQIPDGPDEALGAYDTRNLLRRGTAEGWAEVRFVGTDGRRYRARWSVRRARGQPGGRLQQVEHELRDEAIDQPIGRTRGEVLAAIEDKVGLSFDQFRRSVLLAQGDFAAFLRARGDERSELLERMTGTEIYSTLSMRAHAKAKAVDDLLRQLELQLGAVQTLGEDERAALRQRAADLQGQANDLAARLEALRADQAWWKQQQALQTRLEQTRSQATASAAAWQQAAPRAAALADIERAQPLRAVRDEVRRAAAAHTQARQQRDAAAKALAQAGEDQRLADAALQQAEQALERCNDEAEAAKPQLDLARALDATLAEQHRQLQAAAGECAAARQAEQTLDQQTRQLASEREACAAERAVLEAWTTAHGALLAIAAAWDGGVAPQLQAYAQRHQAWQRAESSLPGLRQRRDQAQDALAPTQQAADEAARALDAARTRARQAEAEEAAQPAARLAERRAASERERTRLAELRQAHEQAATAAARTRTCEAEALAARKQAEQAADTASQAAAARAEVERQRQATERLQAQLDLAAHRARLVEGEPCPLCGSTHHPGAGTVDATVAMLEAQRQQLAQRDATLLQQQASLEAEAAAGRQRALELDREALAQQSVQRDAAARWLAAGGPGAALAVEAAAWLATLQREADAEAAAIDADERAREQLRQATDAARRALDAATATAEQARRGLDAAHQAAAAAAQAYKDATAARDAERGKLDALLESLAPALGAIEGWPLALQRDPQAFFEQRRFDVEQARAKLRQHERLGRRSAEIELRAGSLAAELAQSRKQRERSEAEHARLAQQSARLQGERQALLQGRPVAEAEAALRTAREACERALGEARARADRCREAKAHADAALAHAEQAATRAAQQQADAESALDQALAAAGLDAATLDARLAPPPDWIAHERAALQALERQALADAQALAERQRDCDLHAAALQPALAADAVEQQIASLEPQVRACSERLGAVRQQLQQDDDKRTAFAELARRLEHERGEARVWQQLDALIGSADGRKFRRFAQSLTLELLLAHANAQLVDLAPRYRLQRVKAQDLELQVVDRDMGDEIRSTASLSGGETFLVSLALALGLSALASQRLRIESLFIDEGFGALDAHTLETALAALDALQSVGRKVGLISHVPGLAERIGVQVRVERLGHGASRVRVVGA
jgi:exonuclease SbcC